MAGEEVQGRDAAFPGPPDWPRAGGARRRGGRRRHEPAQPRVLAAARPDVAVRLVPPEDPAHWRRTGGVSRRISSVSMVGRGLWESLSKQAQKLKIVIISDFVEN